MTRREALNPIAGPPRSANRGLWLDRYLASMKHDANEDGETAKTTHLKAALCIDIPDGYSELTKSRRASLDALEHTRVIELSTLGRTIVGIGRATPWENSITLHHTWGVPVVSGSALKGLAASYAHRRLEAEQWRRRLPDKSESKSGEWHSLLFGTTDERGLVCFHDALWKHDPSETTCGLKMDTITVHHPGYYQGKDEPPADWDSPTPIPFLSFNGSLIGAISWCGGPASDEAVGRWLDIALDILKMALAEEGVGAKTSSGYGRMELAELLSEAEQKLRMLKATVDELVFPEAPGDVSRIDEKVDRLVCAEQSELLLGLFVARVDSESSTKRKLARERLIWLASNPKYTALAALIPQGWKSAEAKTDPVAELRELEAKLAAHDEKKPPDREKRTKWRKERDKLEKLVAEMKARIEKA